MTNNAWLPYKWGGHLPEVCRKYWSNKERHNVGIYVDKVCNRIQMFEKLQRFLVHFKNLCFVSSKQFQTQKPNWPKIVPITECNLDYEGLFPREGLLCLWILSLNNIFDIDPGFNASVVIVCEFSFLFDCACLWKNAKSTLLHLTSYINTTLEHKNATFCTSASGDSLKRPTTCEKDTR